ncbi:MAG: porin family protein [Bacteroidota bacterium]
MKKLGLMFVVLTAIVNKGFSQTAPGNQSFGKKLLSRMEFGLTAGGNASNFTSANFPTDPLPGFQAGLTVAYKFTDNFMVHEEFLYAMQGAKVKGGVLGTQDIKLSYASVPILLKYRTNSGLFVEAGPQASFKIKEDIGGITDTKFFKKIDFGIVGGIGYKSSIGLGIDARYVYGLQKVQENPSVTLGDFKNNSIQASIFYVF